jgi:hypothetical protein
LFSGIADFSALSLVKNGNVSLSKSPLFALFESGQYIFSRELIHRVRAKIQDDGNLPAI